MCVHTLVGERLCTGSQSDSLCRIDTGELRHTSACVRGNGCMLGLRGPAFSAMLLVLVPHIGPYKEMRQHKKPADHIADLVAVADESPDQVNEVD